MPVIVVGADTPLGGASIDALLPGVAELRAFITDPDLIGPLRARGVKVAIGDISDGSHVGGAALNAFCAVLIAEAAHDDRERSFAPTPRAVVEAWAEGLRDAGVTRAIWVDDGTIEGAEETLRPTVREFVVVDATTLHPGEAGAAVAGLEARRTV